MPVNELSDRTFGRIAAIMHASVGLSFNLQKKGLVAARLEPRLNKLGLDQFEDYLDILERDLDPTEFQMAVDLLTTNETYFFREPKHFEFLEQDQRAQRSNKPLKLWSAASSFGDEAYSLAMLLADLEYAGLVGSGWSILGTDISDRVLRAAYEGVYPIDRLRHVSPERLRKYCLKGEGAADGQVMVREELREHVQFGQLNLKHDFSGIGPFDAIFLRNVLIYFDQPTRHAVIEQVLGALKPGGLFFMGTTEGRVPATLPVSFIQTGVYRKGERA